MTKTRRNKPISLSQVQLAAGADEQRARFELDQRSPTPGNPVLAEWKRKNIENYLLVPEAWRRAALQQ